MVRFIITAGSTIQNLARDEYVAASTYAPEPNFGQCGIGHTYEVSFQLQVFFQDLQGVTIGFDIPDRGSIGRHFNHNVIVKVYIAGQ